MACALLCLVLVSLAVVSAQAGGRRDAIRQLQQVFGWPSLPSPWTRPPSPSAPQYMTQLYRSITDADGVVRGKNPYNARVVRSFVERDSSRGDYFVFNVTGLEEGERVLEAELHLYRMKLPPQDLTQEALSSPHLLVRVYQVEDEDALAQADAQRLLSVHYVRLHAAGWLVFNVRPAVLAWVSGTAPNIGLLVTATTLAGDAVPLRWARRGKHHGSRQPILVLFNDDDPDSSHIHAEETPRVGTGHKIHYSWDDNSVDEEEHNVERRSVLPASHVNASESDDECERQPLYVDFEEIGWNSWIIAPSGYKAYHCVGRCGFPLGLNHRPTNHATVQSLVHKLHLAPNVERPSCVPATLAPLGILYFDENLNVILKNFEKMVAESCGCH